MSYLFQDLPDIVEKMQYFVNCLLIQVIESDKLKTVTEMYRFFFVSAFYKRQRQVPVPLIAETAGPALVCSFHKQILYTVIKTVGSFKKVFICIFIAYEDIVNLVKMSFVI
jgi:hypothetical protein